MKTITQQSLISLLAGMMFDPTSLNELIVTSITMDSRQVKTGGLFVSLAKQSEQRQHYLQEALNLGAAVVLFDAEQALTEQEQVALQNANVTVYAIKQLANKTSEIAARFYGHPSMALTVIAVTGTNGKTSVSQFIAQALESVDLACGVMGTLGVGRVNNMTATGMTTPDPISVQAMLAEFCQKNVSYVVIEASSHALQQGRLNSVDIDVAILTNLSRDHLDYHHTMAEYAAAKQQLFQFPNLKMAIINADDDFGQTLLSHLATQQQLNVLTYSQQNKASVYAQKCEARQAGIGFKLINTENDVDIKSPLLGLFNIDNLLATSACLLALDISFDVMVVALSKCHAVAGRMQAYDGEDHAQIVIDFAHTPAALTQALTTLRGHITEQGLLWCVFGCGGDRDIGKRQLMGQSAEDYADRIVLTNDNPRNEEPSAIVEDILAGIAQRDNVHIEYDRQAAIHYALTSANKSDVVLVAGKGHENYQEIAGLKLPFSDYTAVENSVALLRGAAV